MSDCCLTLTQLYHGENKFNEVSFVLDQQAQLDFHSATSLKQQSTDRHVTPLGHSIQILSQPVFALSPECCMLSREATNTKFIVLGLTRSGLEPMIYHTRVGHANHYITDAVKIVMNYYIEKSLKISKE